MSKFVPENYLTVKEVSKILSIHPQTVTDWVREGLIPSYKINGLRRFKPSEIEDWIQERGHKVLASKFSPRLVFNWREFEKLFTGGTSMKVTQISDSRWFCGFGGLFFRTDSNGIKRWLVWWYDEDNQRKHKAVPLVTCKKEALIALEGERRIAFMKRYNPEETEENKKPKYSFQKLSEEWLKGNNRKNKANDRSVLKNLKATFGRLDVAKITRPDIKRYIVERHGKDAAGTIIQRLQVMRVILNYALEMEYDIEKNPIVAKDFPKDKRGKKKPLEMDEIKSLFSAADKDYPHMIPVMATAFMTGMRKGEIETLEWEDVDLEGRAINIKAENNKSGVDKEIPINDTLYYVLADLKSKANGNEYVFTYWNPRFNRESQIPVALHFGEIVEKAGLKGRAHFHLIRHTAASMLIKAGADIVSVQHILGHANLSTTQKYAHPFGDAKRLAVEKLEKQLPIRNLNGNLQESTEVSG